MKTITLTTAATLAAGLAMSAAAAHAIVEQTQVTASESQLNHTTQPQAQPTAPQPTRMPELAPTLGRGWASPYVGQTFHGEINTFGYQIQPHVIKGAIPPGLSFNEEGDLVGTLTDKEPKDYTFTLRFEVWNQAKNLDITLSTKPWPAPGRFTSISAADRSHCGINEASKVYCWGTDWNGQIGSGEDVRTARPIPTLVEGIPGKVSMLALQGDSTCALTEAHDVYCWGANDARKVDPTSDDKIITKPTRVEGLPAGVQGIAMGREHTCVTNGDVYCWGDGFFLGSDNVDDSHTPKKVTINDSSAVVSVTSDYAHTCAATESGNVWCWGSNSEGQVGAHEDQPTQQPVKVSNAIGKVLSVQARYQHTCALNDDGEIWCWGKFPAKAGNSDDVAKPVKMNTGGHNIISLFTGSASTCGKADSGEVLCFGDVHGLAYSSNNTPVTPKVWQSGIKDVALGWRATCGLTDEGRVSCAGSNVEGATGINKLEGTTALAPVKQFS